GEGALDGGPPVPTVAPGAPARELRERDEVALAAGQRAGRGDDRPVGQHAAGGAVPLAGERVTRLPQLPDDGDALAAADGVHTGGAAPRVDARLGVRREADGLELLLGPLELAGLRELGGQAVAQLDEELDVERGVPQP